MNIISDEQVASLLTPSLSIESQRHAFLSPQITPPRNIISGDMVSGPTLFKPSAVSLPTRTHVGIKIVAVRPNNAALDPPLSTVPATILVSVAAILVSVYINSIHDLSCWHGAIPLLLCHTAAAVSYRCYCAILLLPLFILICNPNN